jgi:hypothetical protein
MAQEDCENEANEMASFLEKKAQQEIMKRAIDAAWIGCTCIGMVIGPLVIAFENMNINRTDLNNTINIWVNRWQREVQYLSDRNVHRNREYYAVQPNLILSPILARFSSRLESVRAAPASVESAQMIPPLKEAYTETVKELYGFLEWTKSSEVRSLIDFDASKYEPQAVQRAQKYWTPAVNEIKKSLG